MLGLVLWTASLVLATTDRLWAATSGQEVVVVYNSRMAESKAIAEYYARQRQVPTNQVFGFELPTTEDMSRADYDSALKQPLANALQTHKLWRFETQTTPATNGQPAKPLLKLVESTIRYAVLCYGVPVRISPDPKHQDEGEEKLRPEMRRNEAAVDSELALLPLINEKVPLNGPLRNPLYGSTNEAALHPTNGVLLVTRLDGPNAEIARGLVDKALQGEADGLWGRGYFDLRNTTDPAYKSGDEWIRNASEVCRRLGFETVVDNNPETFPAGFPMSHIAIYLGWYDANVSGPFTRPTVEFMPGAIAYHLHSYSAHPLRSATQAWAGPLLAKGATVTMGCVEEPFLPGTPDLTIFTVRMLFDGMSFGESAYACQPVLSWQTTVVGDPLYRPCGKDPEVLKDELSQRNSKLLDWYFLRLLNVNLAAGKPIAESAKVLEDFDRTKTSAVLTEKLADLYSAQGKPASAIHAYQEALALDPSPQQRIRLLLALGEKLSLVERWADAYQVYQTLLQQAPDYPDKPGIYKRLLPLAQKLDKKGDAEKYEAALQHEAR